MKQDAKKLDAKEELRAERDKNKKDKENSTVEGINKKNEAQPSQPSNNKEDSSYEAQTLMDGVGSSYDDESGK